MPPRMKTADAARAATYVYVSNGGDGDISRGLDGVAVHTGADAWEGERANLIRRGELERAPIARREKLRLAAAPAVPDRTNGMDDELGRQPISPGEPGFAGRAPSQQAAFLEQLSPRGAVDRAIDTAAAEQGRVGRVDDRVDGERGDVSLDRA